MYHRFAIHGSRLFNDWDEKLKWMIRKDCVRATIHSMLSYLDRAFDLSSGIGGTLLEMDYEAMVI